MSTYYLCRCNLHHYLVAVELLARLELLCYVMNIASAVQSSCTCVWIWIQLLDIWSSIDHWSLSTGGCLVYGYLVG